MKEDPAEVVRYEAVMALRNMLTRGCCNMDSVCQCDPCCNRKKIARETEAHARKGTRALLKEAKGPAKKAARKANREAEAEDERYDCCRGCANEKVMKALAEVATKKDDQCCWVEPSERVREAAAEAMCLFPNYADGYGLPDIPPEGVPGTDGNKEGESVPPVQVEEAKPEPTQEATPPTSEKESPANSGASAPGATVPATPVAQTPIEVPPAPDVFPAGTVATFSVKGESEQVSMPVVPGLRGRCIVALKARQNVASDARFCSVYEERSYYFSSAEAKAKFDQNPKLYAPAYGGVDPVVWLAERKLTDGQILREYGGQFYLFSSKENWAAFKGNPQRYVLKSTESNVQIVGGQN